MRIPGVSGEIGSTRPSSQGLSYLRPVENRAGQYIAQGLGQLGEAFQAHANVVDARQDKTARLQAMTNYSQFESDADAAMMELKRSAQPDGANFYQQADSAYTSLENEFIQKKIPPDLQEEFRFRTKQTRSRVMDDALKFQFGQQDAFFNTSIESEYTRAQNGVAASPDQFDSWNKHLSEIINNTDLPTAVKKDWQDKTKAGLTTILYGKDVEDIKREHASMSVADKIIGVESGGSSNADNPNSSAYGPGQFIDSTWRQFIQERHPDLLAQGEDIYKYKSDKGLAKEAVNWYAQANAQALGAAGISVTDGALYLAHFAGPAGAIALMKADPGASAESVLGSNVVNANPFLKGKNAADVIQWANHKMGGGDELSALNSDPIFDSVPLKDRLAIEGDATSKVNAEQVAASKADAAAHNVWLNQFYTGIHDGSNGQAAIEAARRLGQLTDFDEIAKAEGLVKTYQGDLQEKMNFASILDNVPGSTYNPNKDNTAFNKYIGDEGLSRVSAGDRGYVAQTVLPAIQQTHDVPTDLVGQLTAMTRSNNPEASNYAYDVLSQIRATDAAAFNGRVSNDLAAQVDFWSARKDSVPADKLAEMMKGGYTVEEQNRRRVLREEGAKILTSTPNKIPHIEDLMTQVFAGFKSPGWFQDTPTTVSLAGMKNSLEADFTNAFLDSYTMYGNEQQSTDAAIKQLQRTYGTTTVGGETKLMKYPPQAMGYQPAGGSFSWIEDQVRAEIGLTEPFQLLADEQTRSEFGKWQQGGQGQPLADPFSAVSNPPGLIQKGNIDLNQRPRVKNPDGSVSTVLSASFNIDGQEVLLPTISPSGARLTNEGAIALYQATGKHLGKFATPEAANTYAQALHEQQAQMLNGPPPPSYMIVVTRDGLPQVLMNGRYPDRRYFTQPARDAGKEMQDFTMENQTFLGRMKSLNTEIDRVGP